MALEGLDLGDWPRGETGAIRRLIGGVLPHYPAVPAHRGTFQLTGEEALYALTAFMKVVSSIKSAKKRHPACQVVRRKGKIYVINKVEPRYKARQG